MPNTDKTILLPQLQRYDEKIKGWADAKFLTKADTPSLPKATATTLGGVKVGSGLNVTDDGILSAEDDIVFTWDFDTSAFSCNKTFAEVKKIITTGVRRTATANGIPEGFSVTLLVGVANDNAVMFFGTAPRKALGAGKLGSRTDGTITYLFQKGLVILYNSNGQIQKTEDLSNLNTNMSFDFKNTTFQYDQYSSFDLKDGGITSTKLADGAITAAKLASSAVTADKIADGAITVDKLASGVGGLSVVEITPDTTDFIPQDQRDAIIASWPNVVLKLREDLYMPFGTWEGEQNWGGNPPIIEPYTAFQFGAADTLDVGSVQLPRTYSIVIKSNTLKITKENSFLGKAQPGINGGFGIMAADERTLACDPTGTGKLSVKHHGITADELASGAVTADKIADGAITKAKLASNVGAGGGGKIFNLGKLSQGTLLSIVSFDCGNFIMYLVSFNIEPTPSGSQISYNLRGTDLLVSPKSTGTVHIVPPSSKSGFYSYTLTWFQPKSASAKAALATLLPVQDECEQMEVEVAKLEQDWIDNQDETVAVDGNGVPITIATKKTDLEKMKEELEKKKAELEKLREDYFSKLGDWKNEVQE